MNPQPFLLAAAIDAELVKLAVLAVFLILAGVGKLLTMMGQGQPPGGGARPQPPRPAPDDVADEIDEFLRRAAQGREAPKQPARAVPVQQPVAAEVVAETGKPIGAQLPEHVSKYLDSEAFDHRAGELGEEVAQADQQIDQHLHKVFDHAVSRLAAVPGEAAAPPTAVGLPGAVETPVEVPAAYAEGLLAILSDPESIRQAVVFTELFRRPEERW